MNAKQTTKKIYKAPKIAVIHCLSAQMLCGSYDEVIGGGGGTVDEGGALSNKYRNDWANIWKNR